MSDIHLKRLRESINPDKHRMVFIETDVLPALVEVITDEYGDDYPMLGWLDILLQDGDEILSVLSIALFNAMVGIAADDSEEITCESSFVEQISQSVIDDYIELGFDKGDFGYLVMITVVNHDTIALHFNFNDEED